MDAPLQTEEGLHDAGGVKAVWKIKKTLYSLGTDLKLLPPSQPDEEYRNLPPCTRLGDCFCFPFNFTAFPLLKTKRELSKVEENSKLFPFPAHFLLYFPFQLLKHRWCIRGTSACS